MDKKDIIARNLLAYRKKAGLSQLELAEKLNYSNKNISKWENGETTPNIFVLKEIADIYKIKVDDLLNEGEVIDQQTEKEFSTLKAKRKTVYNYTMLVMANAILFTLACIAILVLTLCKVTTFNKWLLLLYITPLMSLSVFIFIRCIYKRADPISISLFGWLIALCLYVSLPNIENLSMVFIVAAAYQFLIICIAVAANLKLVEKFTDKFKKFKEKYMNKKDA